MWVLPTCKRRRSFEVNANSCQVFFRGAWQLKTGTDLVKALLREASQFQGQRGFAQGLLANSVAVSRSTRICVRSFCGRRRGVKVTVYTRAPTCGAGIIRAPSISERLSHASTSSPATRRRTLPDGLSVARSYQSKGTCESKVEGAGFQAVCYCFAAENNH